MVLAHALLALPLLSVTAQGGAPVQSEAALVIDGTPIPWSGYGAWLVSLRGEAYVERYLPHRLLEREAKRRGFTVTREELLAQVYAEIDERVDLAFAGDREAWVAEVLRLGSTPESLVERRVVESVGRIIADRILAADRVVADEEVRALYARRYGRDGRRLHLRALRLRLVVPTPPPGTTQEERLRLAEEAKDAIRARLAALRGRALAGEDFVALVREYTEDPAGRARDGALDDAFDEAGWPAEAVDAAYALGPHDLSDPVYGRGFYNVFQLVREERRSFEDLEGTLRHELQNRAASAGEIEDLTRALRDGVTVVVHPSIYSGSGSMDEAVFSVDGEAVTRGTYALWLGRSHGEGFARSFAEDWLARRAAEAAGITVSEDDVARRIEADIQRVIDQFHHGDADAWRASLAANGGYEARARRDRIVRTRTDLLAEELILRERVVTPDELRALWEVRYGPDGRSLDVRVLALNIVVPPEASGASPTERERIIETAREAARARTEGLRDRAIDGEDFGTLAEQHSDDPRTRNRGGRFAGRFPLERMPENVQREIGELAAGGITPPVDLGSAWFLFELVSEDLVPLGDVEAELTEELRLRRPSSAERAGYLNALLQGVEWSVHPANFR